MSRIIRGAFQKEEKEIRILPFKHFLPLTEDDLEEVEVEPVITREQVLAERDQLLADARLQLEQERAQLEAYKQEQMQAIEELKLMWEEEKQILQQQAYEESFAQGFEEGMQKAQAEMEHAIQIANSTIEDAKKNAESYLESQEPVILELALSSAEKIIDEHLDRNDAHFISIVKRALKDAREMKEIKIYVAPQYYQVVTQNRDELAEMFPTDVPFMIFVNEELENADCYIETNHGRIVVSIDIQLNELRLKLREILDSKE